MEEGPATDELDEIAGDEDAKAELVETELAKELDNERKKCKEERKQYEQELNHLRTEQGRGEVKTVFHEDELVLTESVVKEHHEYQQEQHTWRELNKIGEVIEFSLWFLLFHQKKV